MTEFSDKILDSRPRNRLDLRFALDEDAEELSDYVNKRHSLEEDGSSDLALVFRKAVGRVSANEVSSHSIYFRLMNNCI